MNSHKKALGFWLLCSLVIGNLIGSGIFLLPSTFAQYGSISLVAWLITAGGAITVALVFARLSRLYPKVGGPFVYCYETFGEFLGFQISFNYWTAVWVANAALVVGMVGYMSFFFPELAKNHLYAFFTASGILWVFTLVNVIGVRQAGITQFILTILKLIPLFIIVGIGCFYAHPHYLADFNVSGKSPLSALSVTGLLAMWTFLGLESATLPVDQVSCPEKNIPRATICGTVFSALVYIGATAIIMSIIPMHMLAQSASPFADVARMIFGHIGGALVAIIALIAIAGTLNGFILVQGQIPITAAQYGLFPKFFLKTSKNGTPVLALVLSSVLINIVLACSYNDSLISQYTSIVLLATFANIIPYFYTSLAEIIILVRRKKEFSTEKMRHHIIIAIIACVFIFWMMFGAGAQIVFYGMLLLFGSAPLYVWLKTHRERHVKC